VTRVVFDKTGTLTTGELRLEEPAALGSLAEGERTVLWNMASRSAHPKSLALVRALEELKLRGPFLDGLAVRELPGRGLELRSEGRVYRLGAPAFVVGVSAGQQVRRRGHSGSSEGAGAQVDDVAFGVDGELLREFRTLEDPRPDAVQEVGELVEDGYRVDILSGDSQERVEALARQVGLGPDHVFAEHAPGEKAAWVRARDRQDILFLGDGLNDGPVVSAAYASGTPAIDRPFLAARSDFYLVSAGIAPVRAALLGARRLRQVLLSSLAVALAYNVLTVGLATAGRMTPLVCAVLMPLSSISTILAVLVSLSRASWQKAPRLRTVHPWK
jgi:Cu2+-exporting ATPase